MKSTACLGIALIILGIQLFAYQDIACTDWRKCLDLGTIVGGVVLLVVNCKEPIGYGHDDDSLSK